MGSIQSIIVRPEKRGVPKHISNAKIVFGGIDGDHYFKPDSGRQVTLVAGHDLATVSAIVGFQGDAHAACRRNICVDVLPDEDMIGKRIVLGTDVILEVTCYCYPCKRMDENFGAGAIQAFEKKAGWGAIVLREGHVSVGDTFEVL